MSASLGHPGGGPPSRGRPAGTAVTVDDVRHLLAGVVGLALAALTVLALAGSSRLDGPVIWVLSDRHGLHRGDLAVLAVGAVGLLTLLGLHRRARRRPAAVTREREHVSR